MSTPDTAPPGPDAVAVVPDAREVLLSHPADWRWWEAIAAFIVCAIIGIFAGSAVAIVVPEDLAGIDILLSMVLDGVILGGLLLWLRIGHPGWRPMINLWPSHPLEEIWAGLVRGLVTYVSAAFIVALPLTWILEQISGEPATTPEQIPPDATSGWGAVMAIVFAALVAPIVEEFFFRGIFFRAMRARTGLWPAAISSGVFFAVIHFDPVAPIQDALLLVLVMVFVGTAFAYIYERRGTLLAPIAAHVTFNIIGLAYILSGRT